MWTYGLLPRAGRLVDRSLTGSRRPVLMPHSLPTAASGSGGCGVAEWPSGVSLLGVGRQRRYLSDQARLDHRLELLRHGIE